jgi:hypothetical protein
VNRSRRTRDRGPGRDRPSRDELRTRSDEQLVELVLDGYDAAFDVLFDRHVADSLWYAREVLGTWGEAEEAVRHAFAAAHAYLAARGRETEFWPWLQTILGNYCLSMLQARAPGPKDEGTVVDLGEWRLRRKLFGIGLPAAPGAGLREGLMAACGLGGGAAAAGAPLMTGALAKLAVVAVLAGAAGVVGVATYERPGSADAGVEVSAARTLDRSGRAPDAESERGPAGQAPSSLVATVRRLGRGSRGTRAYLPRRGKAPPTPGSGDPASAPSTGSGPRAQVAPAPVDAAPVRVTDSLVRRVADVVERPPPVGEAPQEPLAGSLDLSKIGDDLGVSAAIPPVEVRAVLSRGVAVLSK